MASPRPKMFALLGMCLTVLVSCKADYPVYHYQGYYPHKYYPTYDYKYDSAHTHKTYSVIPFKNYPVYHTGDYVAHKEPHYDPHVYLYSGWPQHHHQPYTYDHDWYGYQGHAPVYRPSWPHSYSTPYFNVYNRFEGGVTSQRSDAKADASSSTGSGGSHTTADKSGEIPSSREAPSTSREAPSSSSAESASTQASSGEAKVQFAPRIGRFPPRPAGSPVSLPPSLREAWRNDAASPEPQSDAAWNFVAGKTPAASQWYRRSGYKHIDQVRPTQALKAHHQ